MHRCGSLVVLALVLAAGAAPAQVWSLERHRVLPPGRGTVAADFDGDGDIDLVWLGASAAGIARNDGSGRFTLAPTPVPAFGRMAAGDIDGDGDADLAISGSFFFSYIPAQLLRNDGAAGFTNVSSQWPTFNDASRELLLVDYDGDGDLDIVSCAAIVGQIAGTLPQPINRLYLNSGTGVFTDVTATRMPNVAAWNHGVAAGDIDGDGDVDLVFATGYASASSPARVRMFVQNAAGVAVEAAGLPIVPIGTDSFWDVALTDHDLDGDLDVAAASTSGVQFFANNGTGAFSLSQQLPGEATQWSAADFDGDGRVDLLAACAERVARTPLPPVLYRCTPAGFVDVTATAVEAAGLSPDSMLVLDVDGDGDADVLGNEPTQSMVWHNDGQGLLCQLAGDDLMAANVLLAAAADADGDGHQDAAFVAAGFVDSFRRVVFARGNVGGPSAAALQTLIPSSWDPLPTCVAWLDADLDNDLDLMIGVRPGVTPNARDRLFHNVNGTFVDVTGTHMPAIPAGTLRFVTGDLDGDGATDALTCGMGSTFYRGNGAGGFVDASNVLPPLPPFSSVSDAALLDIDGDLDLDVVQTFASDSNPTGTLRLLRNDWPATFADVTPANLLPWNAWSVATLDIDRDGRDDLLFGIATGAAANGLKLFRSTGTGFVDESATRLPVTPMATQRSLAVRDFDGDGWLDVLCHPQSETQEVLLRNNNGVMVVVPVGNVLPYSNLARHPAAADLDGDGDVDLVDTPGAVKNLTRELQNAVPPRLGAAAELVLHAHAGDGTNPQLAVLLLAPLAATPPLPAGALGTLFVDPASVFVHSVQAIAASGGEVVVPYTMGSSPGLLGVTLFAQALFVHQPNPATWRLGNLLELRVRL